VFRVFCQTPDGGTGSEFHSQAKTRNGELGPDFRDEYQMYSRARSYEDIRILCNHIQSPTINGIKIHNDEAHTWSGITQSITLSSHLPFPPLFQSQSTLYLYKRAFLHSHSHKKNHQPGAQLALSRPRSTLASHRTSPTTTTKITKCDFQFSSAHKAV
jgi:hypothetical protein